jgi:sugar lactone lactonase YvrE
MQLINQLVMKRMIFLIIAFFSFNWSCREDFIIAPDSYTVNGETSRAKKTFPDILPLPIGFQPEGIVVGKGTDFYVGSLSTGAIYKGDLATGQGDVWLLPPNPGSGVGLSFDPRNDLLYVAGGFAGNAFVYNTRSGSLVTMFQFAPPGPFLSTMVNDVVVTKNAAYFTDSFRPVMYKVPIGPAGRLSDPYAFDTIALSGDFFMTPDPPPFFPAPVNANGIEVTPNGKYLILGNLSTGLFYLVDPETGHTTHIDIGGEALVYSDGIVLEGQTLYVVRNLLNEITEIRLSPDLISGEVIGQIHNPVFKIPSTIANFGNALYAVNARFDVAPPPGIFPDVEFDIVRVEK